MQATTVPTIPNQKEIWCRQLPSPSAGGATLSDASGNGIPAGGANGSVGADGAADFAAAFFDMRRA